MTLTSDDVNRLSAAHDEVEQSARDLARAIYESPELSLEEFQAHEWSTDLLRSGGFAISTVVGLPTAFVATLDSGKPGPTIGLLAEYDALPGVGHACGHHLIAGSAISAGLALRSVLEKTGGMIKVFGCPAEEIAVGKVAMINAGVFTHTDAALTFHAYHSSTVMTSCTGFRKVSFAFEGAPSHASESPWDGANALDGVLLTFQNIAAFRQFMRDGSRIHGIVTDGGQALNIIPEHASCMFGLRSSDSAELARLRQRIGECAEAAATATGTKVAIQDIAQLDAVRSNRVVDSVVRRGFDRVGEQVGDWNALASTDFGNVSQHIPSALLSVRTWPEQVAFHSREATEASGLPMAFDAMSIGGRIIALSAAELLSNPGLLAAATAEFE